MSRDGAIIEFGGFRLDPAERSLVAADGQPIQLTRRLYDTLLFMVERPGRLLEKQALLDSVWQGAVVEENTLSRTISALRQALGERGGAHRYIETVSGLGYRFIEAVTITNTSPLAPNLVNREPALGVLPFEDLSRTHDQSYFADGIAEEVLNRLASVKRLRVIAKTSSFRFRERPAGAQAIGRSLGVDYLLTGAVRKEGSELRITAQLIEAATDSQRWSQRFDREFALESIFAIQDDIARAVATALSATLGVGQVLAEHTTQDLEAYDLFLRGKAQAEQSGLHAAVRSAELLRAAVSRDPKFAGAWLWLASVSRARLIFAPEHAAGAALDIDEAATWALELAPQWWAAHMAQSWRHHLRRDWLDMERALTRALELAPDIPPELHFNLGVFYAQMNESRLATEHFRSAAQSDPLSLMTSGLLQKELTVSGRAEEAELEYQRSLDLAGDREMAEHLVLHRLWARNEPFREQLRRYLDLTLTKPAPVLEEVYTVCEQPSLALEKLRAAAAAAAYQKPPSQGVVAWWLAAYGDTEASFAALWRAYVDLGYLNVSWLWFPVFARVREHARFAELLERVRLAEYWRAKQR